MLPFDPKKPFYGFTARFPHAKRRIHLFTDGQFVYFRPRNAPDDWLGSFINEYWLHRWRRQPRYLHRIRESICSLLASTRFFRVFWLPDPRQTETRIWQILWHPELVYVVPVGHLKGFKGAFCLPRKSHNKLSIWRTNTQVLKQHFEVEWDDPQSDVRLALPLCDLALSPIGMERNWHSIKWLQGGRIELETILRAAYTCETKWPEESTLFLNIYFTVLEQQVLNSRLFRSHLNWEIDHQDRLTRIATRVCERNRGFYNLPHGNRLNWHRSWKQGEPPSDYYGQINITLIIEPPTQHERMEASLVLRHWLRKNAPDLLADWFPDATSSAE